MIYANIYIYIHDLHTWVYIYGSVSRVANPPPPPPPMVWVQNLHFGYIFMEPAKTHGIYNVLTSLVSETVVFAAFCNTTTTTPPATTTTTTAATTTTTTRKPTY